MSEIPGKFRYTQDHAWVGMEGKEHEEEVTVGLTDFGQALMGEITAVEWLTEGKEVNAGDKVCRLSSSKADVCLSSPLMGRVTEVNAKLKEHSDRVNSACYGKGWLFKLKPVDLQELGELLSADAYGALTEGDED